MGTCTGVTSTCATGGYALESRCHLGKLIKYDTVKKLRWSVNVQNHPIKVIIDNLFNEDWEDGREVPESVDEDEDCMVCFLFIHVCVIYLCCRYRIVSNGSIYDIRCTFTSIVELSSDWRLIYRMVLRWFYTGYD